MGGLVCVWSGRGGVRKRVAGWTEGGTENMGSQFFMKMDFPYIKSLFPCLGRKMLT